MKKTVWRRPIAVLLTMAVLMGCVPNVFAAESDNAVEYRDTNVNTTLRAEPNEASEVLEHVSKGTTIAVFEVVENKYGNTWIRTRVDGQEGFIYSGKLTTEHEHHYCMTVIEDEVKAEICKCGTVRVYQNSDGLISFLSIPATPDTFMSPEVWEAVQTVGDLAIKAGAAVESVKGALAVGGPYLAAAVVIIVAGVVLYATVDIDGTVDEVYSKDTALEKFREFESETEPYQLASTFTSSGSKSTNGLIIIPNTSMTLEEATKVACYKTSTKFIGLPPADLDPTIKSVISLYPDYDIYTLNASDATALAKSFTGVGSGYGYGNSKGLPVAEMDGLSKNAPKDNYYCHYHLFYYSSFAQNKVLHCFYGLPYPLTEFVNGQCPAA